MSMHVCTRIYAGNRIDATRIELVRVASIRALECPVRFTGEVMNVIIHARRKVRVG